MTTVCDVVTGMTKHQQYHGLHCKGKKKGKEDTGPHQQCLPSTMGDIASYKLLCSCLGQP
jgi:hypothetical protein